MNEERKDVYQKITDKIVAGLERGVGKFQFPWHQTGARGFSPVNVLSKKPYRGVNVLVLWVEAEQRNFSSGIWGTYRQWQQLNAQVKKGEKGTSIMFWSFIESGIDDEAEDGEGTKKSRRRAVAKEYWVFNADQVEGYTPAPGPMLSEAERVENAEAFFRSVGADLRAGGDVAGYHIEGDYIVMPSFAQFRSASAYYSVLGHEHVHWTGAKSRIDRALKGRFASQAYAGEELIAELGAAFLGADLGLETEPKPEHAAYISTWLEVLRKDKRAIFTAAGQAQKAIDWLQTKASALRAA